jgi:hypothetical protein
MILHFSLIGEHSPSQKPPKTFRHTTTVNSDKRVYQEQS